MLCIDNTPSPRIYLCFMNINDCKLGPPTSRMQTPSSSPLPNSSISTSVPTITWKEDHRAYSQRN